MKFDQMSPETQWALIQCAITEPAGRSAWQDLLFFAGIALVCFAPVIWGRWYWSRRK